MRVDLRNELLIGAGVTLKRGDTVTLDGSSGQVLKGAVPMIQPALSGDFGKLMAWADKTRRMTVRTNADTPQDARAARSFGAEGIGLSRTEHMFFDADRIHVGARDDPRRRREGPPRRARQAPADPALRISSSCSRSCTACR
jgi:pyruvate,orthophosphate dikinase